MNRTVRLLWTASAVLMASVLAVPMATADDDHEAGQVVISLNAGYNIDDFNASWGTTTLDAFVEGNLYLLDATGLGDVEALADQMQTDPAVLEAEANYYQDTPEGVRYMLVVAIGGGYVEYEDQEIGTRIALDAAHEWSRGAGVTIGLVDTGVDPNHPALAGHLADDGYDFLDGDASPWEEANEIDDDADGLTDEGYGHGTMVAGILALVAPEARILPVRVLDDEGRADAYEIAKAIRYAVNHGANVLNLSFGVPRNISIIGHQVEHASDGLGVPVIAGAGNENREDPAYYPAADGDAIMITGLDSLDVKAEFADWNGKVLLSAPGTGVRSAYPGDRWALGAGNSFATPFVTGAVALMLSLDPTLSPGAIENHLELSVDPIYQHPGNGPYQDDLGSGRINLFNAVDDFAPTNAPETTGGVRVRAYPNPTAAAVRIDLASLGNRNDGNAHILDATGRRLVSLRPDGAGYWWDGRLANGELAPAGVYYARIPTSEGIEKSTIHVIR